MTPGMNDVLLALARRLSHAEAVARLIAKSDDRPEGEALHAVVDLLETIGEMLDEVMLHPTAATD